MATHVHVRARHGRGVDEGTHSTQAGALNPKRNERGVTRQNKSRTTRRESARVGAREGKVWASRSVQLVLPPTYAASVLIVARSTPHAEARGSILRELL